MWQESIAILLLVLAIYILLRPLFSSRKKEQCHCDKQKAS